MDHSRTVVFLGPSLRLEDARAILDATYRPPVRKGDVYRCLADGDVSAIAIIDGVFHGEPSVWHREILEALDEGLHVVGASSMGALRAAELHTHGMAGFGTIFEWYRDGALDGDDEVALLFGPAESGYRALSEPLVNIRATVARAVEEGSLTIAQAATLLDYAKGQFYPERSYRSLLACPAAAAWPPATARALETVLTTRSVDLKRLDAVGLLRHLAARPRPTCRPSRRVDRPTHGERLRHRRFPGGNRGRSGAEVLGGMSLRKEHVRGTHRLVPPEATLASITPHLATFGITRCADVTGLDHIGIPVYCAIRPGARTVQVSNGKGLRAVDAKVSGLMEAIELHHAENPAVGFRRASMAELRRAAEPSADPRGLPDFAGLPSFDEDWRLDWTMGSELLTGEARWIPASAAYCLPERGLFRWSSNGLASGNHPMEATLHALYEVLERHSMSGLVAGADLRFDRSDVFAVETIDDEAVASLVSRVRDAGLTLILLRPRTPLRLHTFMAILCDPDPIGLSRRVDPGYGAHLDPAVAAIRAITEAAQGRLSVIHGSREDIHETTYRDDVQRRLYDFFTRLEPTSSWAEVSSHAHGDLEADYRAVLAVARAAGFDSVYRVEMGRRCPATEITAVKVLVPGALHRFPI